MRRWLAPCLPLFALLCVVAGCSGANTGITNIVTAVNAPTAYLVYPGSAPYAGQVVPQTVVFAQHGLNSSYSVTVTPNGGASPLPFTLNLNPVPQSLPSPLATPPADAIPVTLASASGGGILYQALTTYSVSLTGCPHQNADGSCAVALQTIHAGSFQTGCGLPSTVPIAFLSLANPVPGSSAVPTTIGRIIVSGLFFGSSTPITLSGGGVAVPLGTPTAAASPLPSPLASGLAGGTTPLLQLSAPTLLPATLYSVSFSQSVFSSSNPPACSSLSTQTIGTFTTQ